MGSRYEQRSYDLTWSAVMPSRAAISAGVGTLASARLFQLPCLSTAFIAVAGGSGLGADDVVAVGSPGMTVDEAEDLQMDPEHVWVGTAQDDAVANNTSDYTLGRDPTLGGFGGNNFEVDTHGHSGYWDSGPYGPSESLATRTPRCRGWKRVPR
ncbi:alpha/beta hydrolase [Streptomyces chartreusis]